MFQLMIAFLLIYTCFSEDVSNPELLETTSNFNLIGEGFHRHLVFTAHKLPPNRIYLIKWTIPETYYVDPYQLQDLFRNNSARLTQPINTEQMAHEVSVVHLYLLLEPQKSVVLSIPIHLRYSLPLPHSHYKTAYSLPPTLYSSEVCTSNCSLNENDLVSQWTSFKTQHLKSNQFSIPVGNQQHTFGVTFITLLTCFTSIIIVGCVHVK